MPLAKCVPTTRIWPTGRPLARTGGSLAAREPPITPPSIRPRSAWTWTQQTYGPAQAERGRIEGGVIGGSRAARQPPVLARGLPVGQMREVGTHFANGIFDHRAAVDERELGELLADVVGGQR